MFGLRSQPRVNVIDIGSVGGLGQPWSWHRHRVGATLSFEPNEPPVRSGNRLRFDAAVWNVDGEAEFKVSGAEGVGSSLLDQNFAWVRENFHRLRDQGNPALNATWEARSQVTRTFKVKTRRLDTVLAELAATGWSEKFHFLKSDTQSGEWFVLDGARTYLQQDCLALDLELFRYPLYRGVILEDEVKVLMSGLGFEVAGWTGYQNSFLATSDYLFVRRQPRSDFEARMIESIVAIYNPAGPERVIKRRRGLRSQALECARRLATVIR